MAGAIVTTFLQLNTIFLSMVMEAIPFVLVGVLISGLIQSFITERWIAKIMPKNRFLSSLFGCSVGILFPSCECGIVPITRRLLGKGVPLNAGIAFMLTGPVVNPIVLFSTYVAFGNDWRIVAVRAGMAFAVALVVSVSISLLFPALPLRQAIQEMAASTALSDVPRAPMPLRRKLGSVLTHAVEEFFSVGKYLVLGAFIAACMQTFIPTSSLLHIGSNPIMASLVMMGLAFTMSLCSEADAFIASSFRSTFSMGSISAFLVFGPMIDIKNTLMLLGTFKTKFVVVLIAFVSVSTLTGSLIVGRLIG
ncbi:permease [Paenibacillus sp. LHD-117]|uniref:permease n=1 Tax=Paenibacillus sp. LHD-117 TaxID=3071412 RepID=UPI0027E1EAFB|nr:permease [Paenibacillus sp. LHD-117]MDQ6423505.1 permease [Paenibacillus sp. LHD-117]